MPAKGLKRREAGISLLFISPTLALYTIFFWVPMVFLVIVSLCKWDLFNPLKFVGLENYTRLFADPYFFKSLSISVIYTVSTTGLLVFLGMMFAILFNRPGTIASLARILFFMTAIIPLISAGAIWTWITGPESYSALNSLMSLLGLGRKKWLTDPDLALLCVIGFIAWKNTGFNALIYTAGLRGIPSVYIDAGRIDGASRFQIVKNIIIPLLNPVTLFLIITNMISGWNAFTPVYFLTKGGPGSATRVLPTYLYKYGFNRYQFGFASASAVVLIVIVFIFTYLRLRRL